MRLFSYMIIGYDENGHIDELAPDINDKHWTLGDAIQECQEIASPKYEALEIWLGVEEVPDTFSKDLDYYDVTLPCIIDMVFSFNKELLK